VKGRQCAMGGGGRGQAGEGGGGGVVRQGGRLCESLFGREWQRSAESALVSTEGSYFFSAQGQVSGTE